MNWRLEFTINLSLDKRDSPGMEAWIEVSEECCSQEEQLPELRY